MKKSITLLQCVGQHDVGLDDGGLAALQQAVAPPLYGTLFASGSGVAGK